MFFSFGSVFSNGFDILLSGLYKEPGEIPNIIARFFVKFNVFRFAFSLQVLYD